MGPARRLHGQVISATPVLRRRRLYLGADVAQARSFPLADGPGPAPRSHALRCLWGSLPAAARLYLRSPTLLFPLIALGLLFAFPDFSAASGHSGCGAHGEADGNYYVAAIRGDHSPCCSPFQIRQRLHAIRDAKWRRVLRDQHPALQVSCSPSPRRPPSSPARCLPHLRVSVTFDPGVGASLQVVIGELRACHGLWSVSAVFTFIRSRMLEVRRHRGAPADLCVIVLLVVPHAARLTRGVPKDRDAVPACKQRNGSLRNLPPCARRTTRYPRARLAAS